MKKRAKPFVAWMVPSDLEFGVQPDTWITWNVFGAERARNEIAAGLLAPFVVTPILPDDPKPGETWELPSGGRVEVLSPPYAGVVVVRGDTLRLGMAVGYDADLLRRAPALKASDDCIKDILSALKGAVKTDAARDALRRLAESLEEVP